jgi:hypothetical protein
MESIVIEESGVRQVFERWNDLETVINRSITVTESRSYIGLFQRQYFLTLISPFGTIAGMNWYNEGSVADISVSSIVSVDENKTRRVFISWDKGLMPFSSSNSIEIHEPTRVIASWKTQHWLEVKSNVDEIQVSGTGWYDEGSNVIISTVAEYIVEPRLHKFAFKMWVGMGASVPVIVFPDSETASLKMDTYYIVYASWDEMLYLNVRSSPLDLISGQESGWYNYGAEVNLGKPMDESQGYLFTGWLIDGQSTVKNPPSIIMNKAHVVEAVFTKYYTISFDSYPKVSSMIVDGQIYLSNSFPMTFNWLEGSHHTVILPSSEVEVNAGIRYVFTSWTDSQILTSKNILVTSDAKYTALFETQYYLTIVSQYGSPTGEGWYKSGSIATFGVETFVDIDPSLTRKVFIIWDKGLSPLSSENSIEIKEPLTVSAEWKTQHWLEVKSNVDEIQVSGTGWYDENSNALITAKDQYEPNSKEHKYTFLRWDTLTPGSAPLGDKNNPITNVNMDKPYRVQASWQEWWYLSIVNLIGEPVGEGYYESNSIAKVSVNIIDEVLYEKERWAFIGWHGDITSLNSKVTILMDNSKILNTTWKKQFFLRISTPYGIANGSGWYDEGQNVSFSVNSPVGLGIGSQAVFSGWLGYNEDTGSYGKIVMSNPQTLVAIWTMDNNMQLLILLSTSLAAVIFSGIILERKFKDFQILKNLKGLIDLKKLKGLIDLKKLKGLIDLKKLKSYFF